MIHFCTLFDSYYLDKGLVLYKSLESVSDDFVLYIFCFDDRCFEILNNMKLKHAVILHNSVLEDEELLKIKSQRSKAEYSWTCTPITIEYVLIHYNVDGCTYIDSDMYFFSDPQVLFDEIDENVGDVCIVGHRFNDDELGRSLEKRNGKYCVEFNYFRNNDNGRHVLTWWKERCLEWCFDIPEEDRMGDQKYLNKFPILFKNVHELENKGAGVAPWNLKQYTLLAKEPKISLSYRGQAIDLVFYHYQNIRYMPGRLVNIKSLTDDKPIKYAIYVPYLKEIEKTRCFLKERYGLTFDPSKLVRSSNKILGFLQRHFASLKIRRISDVMNLDRLDSYE